MRVVTSPVFNGGRNGLGSVGEWQDRTDEIAGREGSSRTSSKLPLRGEFDDTLVRP
jgi:hypothetical protein